VPTLATKMENSGIHFMIEDGGACWGSFFLNPSPRMTPCLCFVHRHSRASVSDANVGMVAAEPRTVSALILCILDLILSHLPSAFTLTLAFIFFSLVVHTRY
jgi:hypothetical protein